MGVSGPLLFVFCNISLSVTLFVVATPTPISCCLRQLVGLVHDEGAGVRQDGLLPTAPVDGVRQRQVMVADLEEIAPGIAILPKGAIPAVLPLALADPGDADALPVIAAEMGGLVHVKLPPQGEQGRAGFPVLLLKIQLAQPLLQPHIADVVELPLADHRLEGVIDHAVLRQHVEQQGEVFIPRGGLQGDAGGGDEDGLRSQPASGPETAVYRLGPHTSIDDENEPKSRPCR